MAVVDDSYTGHVETRTAARRSVPGADIIKMSVGAMNDNAYLVSCSKTGESLLIDATNDADLLVGLVRDRGRPLHRLSCTVERADRRRPEAVPRRTAPAERGVVTHRRLRGSRAIPLSV